MIKDPSSPVKANNFNTLNPDLLTLYLRPSQIKIWPTYAVPPTTTLYPRSTNDLWRAGSSPTIFQPVEKLIPLTTTSQSGLDQAPLYFRPTYALPDQGPLIADPSIFPDRERAGVDRVSGVKGPLGHSVCFTLTEKGLILHLPKVFSVSELYSIISQKSSKWYFHFRLTSLTFS